MKLEYNRTYFVTDTPKVISEIFDNPTLYENQIFNVSKVNLGDLSESIWYVCIFKLITEGDNTRYAFIPLFDNNMQSFLKDIVIIDSYLIDTVLVYDWEVIGNPVHDKGFKAYKLPLGAYMDYDNRTNEKDGTWEVTVFVDNVERKLITKDWKELVLV